MRKLLVAALFTVNFLSVNAQSGNPATHSEIPLMRQLYHQNIDKSQKEIDALDGINDGEFKPSADDEVNTKANNAATTVIDKIQDDIEADGTMDTNEKIKYLRSLNEALVAYISDYRYKRIKASQLADLIDAFKEGMKLQRNNQSLFPLVRKNQMEIGNILVKCFAFKDNAGIQECKDELVLKYCTRYPEQILATLNNNQNVPFRDSLIKKVAYTQQENLYNYAKAGNSFASRIAEVDEPLVKIISRMARMKTGRVYFPFLDNLYRGKTTFAEIDSAMNNDETYYSYLVRTEMDYADRIRQHDTPMAMQTLTSWLGQKGKEIYINEINGLHESPDNIRFKKIEKLNPQELYYLAVLSEEEIYTSSYVKGVYPRIWKGKMRKGDSLMMSVTFDKFKKWIKMAANYNTLDDFLSRMDKQNAQWLMKAFVNGLDKTRSLEDAVDVANSYASINNPELRTLLLDQVEYNQQKAQEANNVRGARIYSILNTIFRSIDPSNKIDLTAELGIPPVYSMPNQMMKDTSGRIVIQQFWYGDKDGKTFFPQFISSFNNANWKIIPSAQWVEVRSVKGAKVSIFSNRPLDEEKGLDDDAQKALIQYMDDNGLEPTLVIHRGHSYYLNTTLQRLAPSAKVVVLGSCGGYNSLSTVLGKCPTAQIVSSKQTGFGGINTPVIYSIVETLRENKDLNWPAMWKGLQKTLKNASFDDYIPPYKNLGAVFIMAYKKMEEKDSQREN